MPLKAAAVRHVSASVADMKSHSTESCLLPEGAAKHSQRHIFRPSRRADRMRVSSERSRHLTSFVGLDQSNQNRNLFACQQMSDNSGNPASEDRARGGLAMLLHLACCPRAKLLHTTVQCNLVGAATRRYAVCAVGDSLQHHQRGAE